MKKYIKYIVMAVLITGSMTFYSCTDLVETPRDKVTSDVLVQDPTMIPNLMAPALGQLRGLWSKDRLWGLQEATSDELCFPTRGTDWGDNGLWKDHYYHTWNPITSTVGNTWNILNQGISSANFGISVLGTEENVSPQVLGYRGMLRFLRDYYMYCLIDLYGVAPYRDPFNLDYTTDPTYLTRKEAFNFIASDLKQIIGNMPEKADAVYGVPNKDAVRMLLAKMYINKEVYTGTAAWDSSLIYLNQIIDPGKYQLANNYFNMFSPDNHLNAGNADDEAIFVAALDDGDDYGIDEIVVWVQITFHYKQTLMGVFRNWNGAMAPEGYLNECWINGTDITKDVRWVDSTIYPVMAVVNGFNYGQQYDLNHVALTTRGGSPLNFTFECPFKDATEEQGVRVLKYAPRNVPVKVIRTPNDFLIWRYADALLMKAECLARKGDMGGALAIVNQIREKRKAPALASLQLLDILKERGRELYWEGHRRQDQIRFGTFLLPKTNKPDISPETALLVPIPQSALEASGGKLKQNPGY
jgi:starch-binding outer membrane protein, SusD/RagB family